MESVFVIDEEVNGTDINESLLSDNKDPLSDDTHEESSLTNLDIHVKEEVTNDPLPQSYFPKLKYDVNEDCFKQEVLHEEIDIKPEIEDHTLRKSTPRLVLNSGFQASMLTRIADKPYGCSICTATFKHKNAFSGHIKMHSANRTPISDCYKRFKCNICPTKFMYKTGLQAHMLTHTGEKPFVCTICNFKADQKNILKQHIKIHLQKKTPQKVTQQFACIICEKSFVHNSALQAHMITHPGEKPFQCVMCSAKFRQKNSLTLHLKIHLEEELLKCSLCEYRCAHQQSLDKHMKIHRSGKIFRCFVCNIYFVLKSNLDQHMETHAASQK